MIFRKNKTADMTYDKTVFQSELFSDAAACFRIGIKARCIYGIFYQTNLALPDGFCAEQPSCRIIGTGCIMGRKGF